MAKEDKIKDKLNDQKYIEEAANDFTKDTEVILLKLVYNKEPENYVRERYTSRGKRFYNPKEAIMKAMKSELQEMIPDEVKNKLNNLFLLKDSIFYVYLDIDFLY